VETQRNYIDIIFASWRLCGSRLFFIL